MRTIGIAVCLAVLSCLAWWGCTDDRAAEPKAATVASPASEAESEEGDSDAEKGALAAAASVSIEQAVRAGIARQPGTVIEAELEREDGRVVWELEIVSADGAVVELAVDASSGSIVED